MPINTSQIYLNLDTNKPNVKIDERFLQGNTDKTLNIKFLKNNEPITITDGVKATLTLVFYNGSSVYKKYIISPTLDAGGNNPNYQIPAITNNILTIPFTGDIAFVDHAGRTDLIIKIDDSGAYYTYSCTYNVDKNEAYSDAGIMDNLPKIDNIISDVSTLKNNVSTNTADIITAKSDILTKANKDLSNVQSFSDAPDGSLLYKKNNQLTHTPIIIDDTNKIIDSPYSLKVPANTIELGENISIHENGGFIENNTKTSGKYYLMLDYENDRNDGTKKPIYYERGAKVVKYEINPINTTIMNNITSIILGNPNADRQVQALYFNFANNSNNLKIKISVNNNDVAYYPSEIAWKNNSEPGINAVAGLQRIPLEPFWSSLVEYNITLTLKADGPINLMGDGSKPYYAVDMNLITRKNVALEEDITNSNETPLGIRNKLQTLTGDDRLSANYIKDIPLPTDPETGASIKNKLETLPEGQRLSIRKIDGVNDLIQEILNDVQTLINGGGA